MWATLFDAALKDGYFFCHILKGGMQVTYKRLLVGALWLVCCVAGMPVKASTLILVFDTSSLPGIQSSVPTLTLNFGNSTDNATTFTGADFLSRTFTNVDLIPLPSCILSIISRSKFGKYDRNYRRIR